MFDIKTLQHIPAKWQTVIPGVRAIRGVCIHAMEAPEKPDTAENVGLYFRRGEKQASAHIGVDVDSAVRYVEDNNVAWAAPGVNNDFLHLELAGISAQNQREWADDYSIKMLAIAADIVAQWCIAYKVPVVRLSLDELRARKHGIIGHIDATLVYKPNKGHSDPGPSFPWAAFLALVSRSIVQVGQPQA